MENTRRRGSRGEAIAAEFLRLKGFTIVDHNVRYARREVDLVAIDGDWLVAVEVKLRRGRRYGSALESLARPQLARVREAITGIAEQAGHLRPRVDLIAIDIDDRMETMTVNHIRGVR